MGRIDPELRRQLRHVENARSGRSRRRVEAVIRLRPGDSRGRVPPAPEMRRMADRLVERIAQELGAEAADYEYNVFPNLGYLVVSAPAAFVERVLAQPEVASATANRRPQEVP